MVKIGAIGLLVDNSLVAPVFGLIFAPSSTSTASTTPSTISFSPTSTVIHNVTAVLFVLVNILAALMLLTILLLLLSIVFRLHFCSTPVVSVARPLLTATTLPLCYLLLISVSLAAISALSIHIIDLTMPTPASTIMVLLVKVLVLRGMMVAHASTSTSAITSERLILLVSAPLTILTFLRTCIFRILVLLVLLIVVLLLLILLLVPVVLPAITSIIFLRRSIATTTISCISAICWSSLVPLKLFVMLLGPTLVL